MTAESSIAITLAKSAISSATTSLLSNALSTRRKTKKQHMLDTSRQEEAIASLAEDVAVWSGHIRLRGMASPRDLHTIHVPLTLVKGSDQPSTRNKKGAQLETLDLLTNGLCTLLLGEPGAGKTTTLRYICQHILANASANPTDDISFPIAVRCRDRAFRNNTSLYDILLSKLGIDLIRNNDLSVTSYEAAQLRVLSAFLNATKPILIIDGLDELPLDALEPILDQIEKLLSHASNYTILVSARFESLPSTIEQLRVVSIKPLSDKQIELATQAWFEGALDRSNNFLNALKSKPYKEVARTPLHLSNLLIIFELSDSLPEQHLSIYKRIVKLRVFDWDEQKRVVRDSVFDNFLPDDKEQFLAALAFELRCESSRLVFTESEVQRCCRSIASQFNLPQGKWSKIIKELQSHTGLLEMASDSELQFYHKTIQEYLCAYNIANSAGAMLYVKQISDMPEETALAVMLSGNSAKTFALVAMNKHLSANFWTRCLHKFCLERARFNIDIVFGAAVLEVLSSQFELKVTNKARESFGTTSLSSKQGSQIIDKTMVPINRVMRLPGVLASMRRASVYFRGDNRDPMLGVRVLFNDNNRDFGYFRPTPAYWIPAHLWAKIKE